VGEGKISKKVQYQFMTSYTWSHPTTKDKNYIYYDEKCVVKNIDGRIDTLRQICSFANTSSDTTRNVLKYRIEHMVKVDMEFTFFKKFALGGTFNYYSAMRNVDRFMFENDIADPYMPFDRIKLIASYGDAPFYGFYNFFQKNKNGSVTLDLRASYFFDKVTISFIVKNVTNRLYALRPLYAEPPRTYTLQLIVKI
jgi:outer membrane receptor protein involved in Fe transport